jgi:hypothetical protein
MDKTKIIQNFNSRNDAFDWVMEKIQGVTIGDISTDSIFRDTDAVIGESDQIIFVGLYNVDSIC